ncbi:MAG TPA: ATP-dependent DNA ligase, partial [Gemmatimonadales bacterium]|nr:ATP-dependent DNA ligase [Gemmatimonadales bacterium]
MKAFAQLYSSIDETNSTNEKVAALVEYFRTAPPADAAWAVHFLSGRRPKRLVGSRKLAAWASQEADVPQWLFEESYQSVGDLAETITLILPDTGSSSELPLSQWVDRLLGLRGEDDDVQREVMI